MSKLSSSIKTRLENNIFGENSIAVYGGAFHVARAIEDNTYTLEQLVSFLEGAIVDAKFFTPEVKPSKVAKNFCHLLLTDPALIEAYLGFKFDELN